MKRIATKKHLQIVGWWPSLSPLLLLVLETGLISSIWILTTKRKTSAVPTEKASAASSCIRSTGKNYPNQSVLQTYFLRVFFMLQKKLHHPLEGKQKWSGLGLMPPSYEPLKELLMIWWYAMPIPYPSSHCHEVIFLYIYMSIWTSIAPKDHQFPAPHSVWEQHFGIHDLNLKGLQESDCWRNGGNTASLQVVGIYSRTISTFVTSLTWAMR